MKPFSELATDTLITGAVATAATTAAVAGCGKLEGQPMSAPINAVSHILWGDEAAWQNDFSAEYTLTGAALNAAAVTSWAGVFEMIFGERAEKCAFTALAGGAAVSALAYITDYRMVPRRLTPGFEKRLSNESLFAVYGVLALSLAVGALLRR